MTKFACRIGRSGIALILASLVISGLGTAEAQELPPYDDLPRREPANAAEQLERALQLIPPQRKEAARKLIRDYPDSREAEVARRVLAEFAVYDRLAADERQRQLACRVPVCEYWKARTACIVPDLTFTPARLVNETSGPVVFQVKLARTVWMGPYFLRVGEEQAVNEPIWIRRIVNGDIVSEPVVPGLTYVFRRMDETDAVVLESMPPGAYIPADAPIIAPPAPAPQDIP